MQMLWSDAVKEAALDLHSSTIPSPIKRRRRRSQKSGSKGTSLIKNHHMRTKAHHGQKGEKKMGVPVEKGLFRHTIHWKIATDFVGKCCFLGHQAAGLEGSPTKKCFTNYTGQAKPWCFLYLFAKPCQKEKPCWGTKRQQLAKLEKDWVCTCLTSTTPGSIQILSK